MAREEVIWCEVHYRQPNVERVIATTRHVVVDKTERGVDLCDACYGDYIAPIKEFIATYGFSLNGTSVRGTRKKSGSGSGAVRQSAHAPVTDDDKNTDGLYACRYEGCDRTFKTPSALGVHLARFTHEPVSSAKASKRSGKAPKKS